MDLSTKIFFSVIKLQELFTLFSINAVTDEIFFYGVLMCVQSEEQTELWFSGLLGIFCICELVILQYILVTNKDVLDWRSQTLTSALMMWDLGSHSSVAVRDVTSCWLVNICHQLEGIMILHDDSIY